MGVDVLCILVSLVCSSQSQAQAPVFEITRVGSSITFHVKASVKIAAKFRPEVAKSTFTSLDETTGALDITIQAASVDTGSGLKNGKLKSKDFFDVERNPLITSKSTKFVRTGPHTFEIDDDFTIHAVSNPEKLTLRFLLKTQVPGRLRELWFLTVRTMR